MEKIAPVVFPSPAVPPKEDAIIIGKATTDKERREIYRLRYQIYAKEIAFKLVTADHANEQLYDKLDERATLLWAKVGSKIIGTGRINIGKLSDFPPDLVETYHMDRFRKFYDKKVDPYFAVISKGMVAPQYRSSPAFHLLMAEAYKLYCDYQIQFAFVNCGFHLIPFYERYGSHRINKTTLDPNLGPLVSLVMLVDDIQHLRKVGSPLFRIARKRTSLNQEVVNWFNSEFACEIKTTINSQLIAVDELWSIICHYLGDMPHHIIPILEELSILEAKLFLHSCGSIVHCHAGDFITAGSNTSQELNILLSGKAHSALDGTILPGQYCGENGLIHRSRHSSSCIALEDSNILVFSSYYFNNFRKRHPNIASKILNNLHKENYYSLYTKISSSIG